MPHNAATARELLLSYQDIFALEPHELGCTSAVEHEICINDEPFKEHFRHIPPPLLEEVHASLQDMLDMSAIWPSQSPWCNAVVLVWKRDRTLHFYVDFRWLNVQTKKDSYPLPWIQEALESMAGAAHFSSMDFKSGFWQVCMAPELQQYTAFTVSNLGFYEFTSDRLDCTPMINMVSLLMVSEVRCVINGLLVVEATGCRLLILGVNAWLM